MMTLAAPMARVVIRLSNGNEVDVENVRCYGQIIVIKPDEPLYSEDETFEAALDREDDPVTPKQIIDLLDAHSGTTAEITAMLSELEERGIVRREELSRILDLAAGLDDLDDQDVLT